MCVEDVPKTELFCFQTLSVSTKIVGNKARVQKNLLKVIWLIVHIIYVLRHPYPCCSQRKVAWQEVNPLYVNGSFLPKSRSKIMYETPPNSSLFGDQWHFMMRALNFNAASPSSGTFSATHLLVLTYLLTSTYSILSLLSKIGTISSFSWLKIRKFRQICGSWETPWSFPWSPLSFGRRLAPGNPRNQFCFSFCSHLNHKRGRREVSQSPY